MGRIHRGNEGRQIRSSGERLIFSGHCASIWDEWWLVCRLCPPIFSWIGEVAADERARAHRRLRIPPGGRALSGSAAFI